MQAQQVECQLAQDSQVLRSMVLAVAREVLVEEDVEHPVQLVLDTPVAAHNGQQAGRRDQLGEQEISHDRLLGAAVDAALQTDARHRRDAGEVVLAGQRPAAHHHGMAMLVSAVAGKLRLLGFLARAGGLDQGARIGKQGRLVLLEGEHIGPAPIEDPAGHLGMAMQGVGRDDAALQREQLQHLQGASHLVAVGRQTLRNGQPGLGRKHVDQMQRRAAPATLEGAAQGLAVHGHDTPQGLGEVPHEAAQSRLEGLRIEQAEHPAEGVVAWNAVFQAQDLAQQGLLGAAEQGHVGAALRPAQHRSQGDEQDLHQIVLRVGGPRIRNLRKAFPEGLHRPLSSARKRPSEASLPLACKTPAPPHAIALPQGGRAGGGC